MKRLRWGRVLMATLAVLSLGSVGLFWSGIAETVKTTMQVLEYKESIEDAPSAALEAGENAAKQASESAGNTLESGKDQAKKASKDGAKALESGEKAANQVAKSDKAQAGKQSVKQASEAAKNVKPPKGLNRLTRNSDSRDRGTAEKTTPKRAYIVGDSITVGATPYYQKAFNDAGWKVDINALGGRSLTSPPMPNGLKAIEQDTAKIKQADSVVVALGTNISPGFEAGVIDAVTRIREINPEAEFYWIDTAAIGPYADYPRINSVLYSQAEELDFTVVPWFRTVSPGKMGFKAGTLTDEHGYLSDRVHPNAEGYEALTKTVIKTVVKGKK